MSADDITISELRETDISGAMRLKSAENWNQTEADWWVLLELGPGLCLVATSGDKVVGTVTATNYHDEIAWIGMMLVDKDFRGLGLGKRLLTTCLEKLSKCQAIKLDATASGLSLYRKLGFREEWLIDRMVSTNANDLPPDEGSQSVKRLTKNELNEAVRLDLEAFGANRGQLIAEFLTENEDKAWYIERGGKLVAYILGRPGSNYTQLGPMSAETEEDAQMLVKAVLRTHIGTPVLVDVLQDKGFLKEMLLLLGFEVQRSFVRMYLKDNLLPGNSQKYFLIAGPELG